MDLETLRREMPITRHYNFLDHAAVAPIPESAVAAMHAAARTAAESVHVVESPYRHAEEVRAAAARLIHAEPEEITFVKNTSEGLAFVANGLHFSAGDNIVTASVEFPANVFPWMNLQPRGVRLKAVPEDNGRIPLERLCEAIDSRTRLVAISAVQYASGFRTDLAELGRVCQQKGVLLAVDAIQALGCLPVDVRAMNIDFLSADGHKWLLGPEGCGLFFCRRELLGHLQPSTLGWLCMKHAGDLDQRSFEFRDDARRFDAGAYNHVGIAGLGASIERLEAIGIETIWAQIKTLTDRLVEGARAKGYRVVSSRRGGETSGIVALTSDRHDLEQVRQHLKAEHRIVVSVRSHRLRVSPHAYNTLEEIDHLVRVLPAH
ncbi:MAG: aminotransferase class V-fold PLP-dependent enzyme [Phycisphaerae bacterium]